MHKVFKVIPKRRIARNGEVLTPEMDIVVTAKSYTSTPFNTFCIEQTIEMYKRIYGFDYKKCGCMSSDFDWYALD